MAFTDQTVMTQALAVFLGGGFGALSRWGVSLYLPNPSATLVVNLIGSFLLAYLSHPLLSLAPTWKLALGTGFMGGFTTYSTYNLLLLSSLQRGHWSSALLQAGLTFWGALLAAALGFWLAERGAFSG